MGALFERVREGVSARTAAEFYGVEIARNGRALCPWHDDQNPDLAFYDDGARCYCHACHNGGDSIALAAQLFGLSMLEAAKKLNADLRLGADETSFPHPSGISRAEKRRRVRQWRAKRYSEVCEVESDAKAQLERIRGGWDSPVFRAMVTALALAQDELDWLHAATLDDLEAITGGDRA